MTAKHAALALALTAALALAGQTALAQRAHAGGGHTGGGGHAVPRGGGYGAGGAQARHPRAGTGGYYHGYYGGHYGGHYPYYGGHYGYYYPYGRSSFYFGAYFGWPYSNSGWWPYGWGGYGYYPGYGYNPGYYAPSYGYGYDAPEAPPSREGERPYRSDRTCAALRADSRDGDTGRVRLEVRPDDTSVYVDDEFCGNAREARFLTLPTGPHAIELVRPGFEIARREVDVVTGETRDVLVELQRP